MVKVRAYTPDDLSAMREIWNQIVEDGVAYPQVEELSQEEAAAFFASQSRSAVAEQDGEVVGLYILHPNNVGRCGHIGNASYGVRRDRRGCGAGRASYSLLHGQILDAFSYNPLMTILLPFIGLYVVVRGMDWVISGENHVDGRISVRLLVAVLILIFVYGVLRNIPTFPFELLAPGGMEKYLVAVSSFSAVRH